MEDRVLDILNEIRPEYDFTSSTNFIEDGFLDSFDIVTIISEIESAFDVIIDGLDVIPENFETIDTIVELIDRSKHV